MAGAEEQYEKIHQNLIDAGCDQQTTELCLAFVEEGQLLDMMPILRNHRNALLDSVHKGQKLGRRKISKRMKRQKKVPQTKITHRHRRMRAQ